MRIKMISQLDTYFTPRTIEHRRLRNDDPPRIPNGTNNNSKLKSYYRFSDLSIKYGFIDTKYMTVSPTDNARYTYDGLDYVIFSNKDTGATLDGDTCKQLTLWCICNLN